MRILHFIYDHINNPWIGGGGAVRAYEIYKRLSKSGHSITVVSGRYPSISNYSEGSLDFIFVGNPSNYPLSTFRYAFESCKLLKTFSKDYDIVIEDFAPWNPILSFRIKNKKAVLLQIQSYLGREILKKYNFFGIPFYLAERVYPGLFDNHLFISPSLRDKFKQRGAVISNGISKDLLDSEANTGDCPAFLGRIDVRTKGIDTLIEAMEILKVPIKVAGSGRDIKIFLKMIDGQENIQWVGIVRGEAKKDFLKKMQFLILPSRYEGQGIVVLEAAACGKPVIVSDIPELRYAVDAGFGISFKTGNARDLADKIRFLSENEPLRKEMGAKARDYARDYTWDKIALDYEKLLADIVSRGGKGP